MGGREEKTREEKKKNCESERALDYFIIISSVSFSNEHSFKFFHRHLPCSLVRQHLQRSRPPSLRALSSQLFSSTSSFFLASTPLGGSRERERRLEEEEKEREKKRERRERVAAKMSRDGERRKKGKKRGRKNEGGDGKEVRGRGGYKDKYQRYDEDQRGGAGAAERVQLVSDDMQQYVSLEGGGGERKKICNSRLVLLSFRFILSFLTKQNKTFFSCFLICLFCFIHLSTTSISIQLYRLSA